MSAQRVTAQPGSRLEQLLASYGPARAAAEEAQANFEAVRDAIKAEATALNSGSDYVVTGSPGLPQLRVVYRNGWRLDTKRLKEDLPETYVRYAVKAGRWELRELKP